MSQIKCEIHKNEDIVLLDISKEPSRMNRNFCLECINEVQVKQTIQIKKIQEQETQYSGKFMEEIKQEYDPWIDKIKEVLKFLNTMKKKILSSFEIMIKKCEEELNEFTKNLNLEHQLSQNFSTELTRTKLSFIGELLSGNYSNEQKFMDSTRKLIKELAINLREVAFDKKLVITVLGQVFMKKIILQSQLKQENICYTLACNQQKNMIVGGRGNEIVVWRQDQCQLIESQVLKGHIDCVTAIVIDQAGDIIVSGASQEDCSLKLWGRQNELWSCRFSTLGHRGRISDLKLIKQQKLLVSSSDDKTIKTWQILKSDSKLLCIQTLEDFKNSVHWITLSQDPIQMASNCWDQKSFNIYENNQFGGWRLRKTIQTKGKVRRVFFTNIGELLVQQADPPQLLVFENKKVNYFEVKQILVLYEQDNEDTLFPIFQIDNAIYLKNDKCIYVIRRLRKGKYFIQQLLNQWCISGCRDCSGEGIVVRNTENKSIEVYK